MSEQFEPAARAELVAMYAGMAMQGLIAANTRLSNTSLAICAVNQGNELVNALEAHHSAADAANVAVITDVVA